jgi:hypothetical protein
MLNETKRNTSEKNIKGVSDTCVSALDGSSSGWRNMALDDK